MLNPPADPSWSVVKVIHKSVEVTMTELGLSAIPFMTSIVPLLIICPVPIVNPSNLSNSALKTVSCKKAPFLFVTIHVHAKLCGYEAGYSGDVMFTSELSIR